MSLRHNLSALSSAKVIVVLITPLIVLVSTFCLAQSPMERDPARPPATFDFDKDREPLASLDGQWRFQPGDDVDGRKGWAQPNFDDSKWPLIISDKPWEEQGYKIKGDTAWYRAKIIIPAGRQPVALFIPFIVNSYQVFSDGELLGGEGRLPPNPRYYTPRPSVYPIPQRNGSQPRTISIAIRVWRWAEWFQGGGYIFSGARIGPPSAFLDKIRSWDYFIELHTGAGTLLGTLEGIAGLAALAFFVLRPKQKEYFWFSAMLLSSAIGRGLDTYSAFESVDDLAKESISGLLTACQALAAIGFYLNLVRPKRNWLFWVAVGLIFVYLCLLPFVFTGTFSYGTWPTRSAFLLVPAQVWIIVSLARGTFNKAADARFFLIPVTIQQAIPLLGAINVLGFVTGWYQMKLNWLYKNWIWDNYRLFEIADTAFVLCAFVFLFLRLTRTRRQETDREREREAARTIQQVLIPEALPNIPGFTIQSIYHPYGEVGGDFFQILPIDHGPHTNSLLIAIGDVSGKGLPAAMTVSLLVGAFRTLAAYTQSPGQILSAMNERMIGRSNGGFTTCLVLRADPDSTLTVANAGHISPYLGGQELVTENGLPLGLAEQATYTELVCSFSVGEQLTLVTDGVVEARSKSGELFGFDRTAAISVDSAESIAQVAQGFGQDDDITVLSVIRSTDSAWEYRIA